MIFNTDLLAEQLTAAGIPGSTYDGIDSEGEPDEVIAWNSTATPQQISDGNAIAATHNHLQLTTAQAIAAAGAALAAGKIYLRNQLAEDVPAALVVIVDQNIKPIVDLNEILTNMMTNQVGLMNGALGWSLNLNPTTAQNRQRYLLAAELVVSLNT